MLCAVALKRTEHPDIHKFIHSICNKKELPQKWKDSITAPIYKKGVKWSAAIIGAYHRY
jgi:hypothetical protein